MTASIITLTTDFGTADAYAGAMKGVILSINPQCTIVDITHEIAPQNILAGSLSLAAACGCFPKGTIHVGVVDPGVGSSRRPVLIDTENYFFVGPDNGLFSFALSGEGAKKVYELSNTAYFRPHPCQTFHGRDIFAPAAAHLSKGVLPVYFGNPVYDPVMMTLPEPLGKGDAEAEGEIIHIDRFGNLITNLSRKFLAGFAGRRAFYAEIKGRTVAGLLETYAGAGEDELFCLFGSTGYLEISVKNKSAAALIDAKVGDTVRVECRRQQ